VTLAKQCTQQVLQHDSAKRATHMVEKIILFSEGVVEVITPKAVIGVGIAGQLSKHFETYGVALAEMHKKKKV